MGLLAWVLGVGGGLFFLAAVLLRLQYLWICLAVVIFSAGLLLGARALRRRSPSSAEPSTRRREKAALVYGRVIAPSGAIVVGVLVALYCFVRAANGTDAFLPPAIGAVLLTLFGIGGLLIYRRQGTRPPES